MARSTAIMTRASSLLACALLVLASHTVSADAPGDTPLHPSVRTLEEHLRDGDASARQAALEALSKSRHPDDAARVLSVFVAAGQPDALADAAVEALGRTGSARALPLLERFRRHRRTGMRRLVYLAIARIHDDNAVALLVDGLRDSDASVRGVAATALGDRNARDQLEPLFHALARGVPEAADSIGRIAAADALPRYHGYLESLPLHVMLDGYRRFLERRDIEEEAQLDIVGRLGEVASPAAKVFLRELLDGGDFHHRKRLRFAIEQTAKRIKPAPAGSGSKP